MSDSTIKNIQLTGGLSTEMGKRKKSKSRTYKIDRDGGGSTSPGTLTQLTASSLPGSTTDPVGINSPLTAAGAPLQIAGKKEDTPVKVVLAAAKKKGRVILAKPTTAPGKTRKTSQSKKVRVTISSLTRKIHKAKAIRKSASESTMEEIKKTLRQASLIKEGSKAPDSILRQMYADYMTLKGRAL